MTEPYTWEYLEVQLNAHKKAGYHVFSVDVDDMLDFVARERDRVPASTEPNQSEINIAVALSVICAIGSAILFMVVYLWPK